MVPVSLCDWPGKITSVLFVGGCNLRCPTCHNTSLAWNWQSLPLDERRSWRLRRRARWLDGITLSGGEPTALVELETLLTELATIGLPLKLDSNGSAPDMLDRLVRSGLVQTLAVDVKGPWSLYPELSGHAMSAPGGPALFRAFVRAGPGISGSSLLPLHQGSAPGGGGYDREVAPAGSRRPCPCVPGFRAPAPKDRNVNPDLPDPPLESTCLSISSNVMAVSKPGPWIESPRLY